MDFIKRNILTDSFLLANIINTFLGCLEYQPMPSKLSRRDVYRY